ncbi:MAG: hypothetical protein AB7G75_21400 [Candidatus Binatia bacterium]
MNILDENIDVIQCRQLRKWKVHFRRIGEDVGRYGMKDRDEIIPLLHALRHVTFFTRDHDFYHPWLRHPEYCLVYLEVNPDEAAEFVRRFLRHPRFRIQAQHLGTVVRVYHESISFWQVRVNSQQEVPW